MQPPVTLNPMALSEPNHARAFRELLNDFARDPMSRGQPLPAGVLEDVVPRLRKRSDVVGFLAFGREEPAGFVLGFEGFSTFAARPLLNVHDLFVEPDWRGRGIGRKLMRRVEAWAQGHNCCKITLEVRRDNEAARNLYRGLGYGSVEQGNDGESMQFWSKPLS